MIPSLLQIPSAVSDSKLHSVLPNNGKGDFTFDRSTGATRINKDGLIEEVGYFSSELVQNGNFSELGSELVTNGDFATDSNWAKGSGWIINNGKASVTTTTINVALTQDGIITVGKTYKVIYEVKDFVAGSIRVRLGDTWGSYRTANGTYTEYLVATTNTDFRFYATAATTELSIDNVSVKQVDPNDRWTLGTGWSYGDGIVEANNTSSFFSQSGLIEASKLYKLTFQARLKSGTNGTINAYIGGSNNQQFTISNTDWQSFTYEDTRGSSVADSIYFNNNGTELELDNISVVEVQGDRPRLSYDITNGVVEDKPHLLLEPSSTNLVTFSNDYTQTFWLKHQSGTASTPIVTSNYEISPDGTRNADRVIFNLNEATDSSFSQLAASLTTSVGNVTNSVYIKSNTDSNYIMNFTKQTGANNLITVTNEWQRFEVTLNNTGTSSVFRIRLRGTESTSDYADVSIFGAQLEQQAYATSYIPTAGTTITRAAETCNNSKPSVNSTEGVLYCEIAALANDNTYRILSVSDGSTNNRAYLQYTVVSNQIKFVYKVGGATQAGIGTATFNIVDFHKIACKWKANDFALWIDGNEVGTDTNGSVNSAGTFTEVNFNNAATTVFYGKVKGLAVYNEALSESQLMQLTGVTASSIYSNFVTRTASFTVEALNEVKKVIDNL